MRGDARKRIDIIFGEPEFIAHQIDLMCPKHHYDCYFADVTTASNYKNILKVPLIPELQEGSGQNQFFEEKALAMLNASIDFFASKKSLSYYVFKENEHFFFGIFKNFLLLTDRLKKIGTNSVIVFENSEPSFISRTVLSLVRYLDYEVNLIGPPAFDPRNAAKKTLLERKKAALESLKNYTFSLRFKPSLSSSLVMEIQKTTDAKKLECVKMRVNECCKRILAESSLEKTDLVFVLFDNEQGFYLQSIYPIIKELNARSSEYVAFCTSSRVENNLNRNNVKAINLEEYVNSIQNEVINSDLRSLTSALDTISKCQPFKSQSQNLLFEFFDDQYFYRELSRNIALQLIFAEVLHVLNSKTVVLCADGEPDANQVAMVCKWLGVKTQTVLPIIKEASPIFSFIYKCDVLCVSGSAVFDTLRSLGIERHRLHLTGLPKFDNLINPHLIDNVEDKSYFTGRAVKIKKRAPHVLVAPSRVRAVNNLDLQAMLSGMLPFCETLTLAVHPMYLGSMSAQTATGKTLRQIKKFCSSRDIRFMIEGNKAEEVQKCDVFFTDYSSLIFEAAILRKDICLLPFKLEFDERFHEDFTSYGIVEVAKNVDQVIDFLREFSLTGSSFRKKKKAYSEFAKRFNYKNDGLASQRFCALLSVGSSFDIPHKNN